MKQRSCLGMAVSVALCCGNGAVVPLAEEQQGARTLTPSQETILDAAPPVASSGADSLDVVAWVDRRDSTYAVGERVRIFVETSEDAYVTLLNVDPVGGTTVLFPNRYQADNFVRAGRAVEVPAPGSRAAFVVASASGTELIKAVASTRPDSLFEAAQLRAAGPFQTVDGRPEDIARSLIPGSARPSGGATNTRPPAGATTPRPPSYQPTAGEWAVCHQTIMTIPRLSAAGLRQRTLQPVQTAADGGAVTCMR